LSQNVIEGRELDLVPSLAKSSRSASLRQWVARVILRINKSNCGHCNSDRRIDGRSGTKRRPALKVIYKFPRRMDPHECSLNISLACAVHRGRPTGTGFGTFPKTTVEVRGFRDVLDLSLSRLVNTAYLCWDGGGGEIARCLTCARKGDRAFDIDPPTSSYAIMRRARPYRGENSGYSAFEVQ
jgi:hypothetical protein